MRMQDVQEAIKKAFEELQKIREEIVVATRERDLVLSEISAQRSGANVVKSEKWILEQIKDLLLRQVGIIDSWRKDRRDLFYKELEKQQAYLAEISDRLVEYKRVEAEYEWKEAQLKYIVSQIEKSTEDLNYLRKTIKDAEISMKEAEQVLTKKERAIEKKVKDIEKSKEESEELKRNLRMYQKGLASYRKRLKADAENLWVADDIPTYEEFFQNPREESVIEKKERKLWYELPDNNN